MKHKHFKQSSDTPDNDESEYDGPSKSQRKRDMHALQQMAEQLVTLPRAELMQLGLGEATWISIDETARIKDKRAMGRHYKRIANCLVRENVEPLQELLDAREARARDAASRHHALERWRARMIEKDDMALTEFFDAYPNADRQELRHMVRAAQRDAERGRPDGPRKLFRALRQVAEQA